MPNLKFLKQLKAKYSDEKPIVSASEITRLIKAFNPERLHIVKESFSFQPNDDLQKYRDYFLKRKKVEAVLLYIDITSFSKKFKNKTANEIADYLDEYYDIVFRIVVKHGGEIEKVIGDGIICVFGEPFLSGSQDDFASHAIICSFELLRDLRGTKFESKIAVHRGEIMYYQNSSEQYYEFTIVGNALTELFRLETVSRSNSISFYNQSTLGKCLIATLIYMKKELPVNIIISDKTPVFFEEIEFNQVKHVQYGK